MPRSAQARLGRDKLSKGTASTHIVARLIDIFGFQLFSNVAIKPQPALVVHRWTSRELEDRCTIEVFSVFFQWQQEYRHREQHKRHSHPY